MFLERLEIAGFKSFANKTALEFFPPQKGHFSVTAIVGPNGSGKSNVADAIRWVFGEQSMKLLRGKKGEDVIFSGSSSAARKSMAEVTLILNNEDRTIDDHGAQIMITRRLYRNGDSEYLINKKAVRLADITLLLARAHMGQNSYSVIGQGMVDHVVVASASERKQFFDEATGVKEFQIKRDQTVNKLRRTKENMREAEMLLREIEPRLRGLRRQVNRLSEKEEVDRELAAVRKQYFGKRWYELSVQHTSIVAELKEHTRTEEKAQRAADELLKKMKSLEQIKEEVPAIDELQQEYEQVLQKRQELSAKRMKLESAVAVAEARAESGVQRALIDPQMIADEVEAMRNEHEALSKAVEREDGESIKRALLRLGGTIKALFKRLKVDKPAKSEQLDKHTATRVEIEDYKKEIAVLDLRIAELRDEMKQAAVQSTQGTSAIFELQHALQEKQRAVHQAERMLHEVDLRRTRVQTQLESLEQEIKSEAAEMVEIVRQITADDVVGADTDQLRPKMYDLRRRSEMIESIDPEVEGEFKELDDRYGTLNAQVEDLTSSIADLENVLRELDRRIAIQRKEGFDNLNKEFQHFFKVLFNGGKAELVPIEARQKEEEGGEEKEMEDNTPKDPWAGIEITATPPGKKIQSIQTLSGGERAMTAIALLCAIVTINPSPFVVLDEVDAALDEGNAARFADIIKELSEKVQFITITHNRTTMHAADALYGVTMGVDSISSLLSMKLEGEKEKVATK